VSHEEAVNEVIEEILSSAGYEVKTTTHPSEVLGLVREFAPDLMLIRLVAPEVNGLDLSEQLVVRFPKVKIVIVGPFCDLRWTETFLQDRGIGCKFLDAPFSQNELLYVVES
jgi:two-component SAPR family response regulator